MIIYAAKLQRKRILFGLVAFVLLCGFLAVYAGTHSLWGAQSAAATAQSERVRTNDARIAYLEGRGWQVVPIAIVTEELRVPTDFSGLADYMALQTAQGFRLEDYAGKKVKRYTYAIENYPTGEEGIMASLLIHKSRVIGGEVFSSQSGQILHGLERPI